MQYGSTADGATIPLARRLEVLQLAKKHNFLILEDDPYFHLYFGDGTPPPSYFSLIHESGEMGRVLRFDSLSKTIAAGLRVGWATGPDALMDAIDLHVCLFTFLVHAPQPHKSAGLMLGYATRLNIASDHPFSLPALGGSKGSLPILEKSRHLTEGGGTCSRRHCRSTWSA
jgi:Aminotransferase class I and II